MRGREGGGRRRSPEAVRGQHQQRTLVTLQSDGDTLRTLLLTTSTNCLFNSKTNYDYSFINY